MMLFKVEPCQVVPEIKKIFFKKSNFYG